MTEPPFRTWQIVLDLFEAEAKPGARIEGETFVYHKPQHRTDGDGYWDVYDNHGKCVDSIRVTAFGSKVKLAIHLDELADCAG